MKTIKILYLIGTISFGIMCGFGHFMFDFFGEKENAFAYLETSMLEDPNFAQYVLWNPYLKSLHDDPRWTALLKKYHSPPAEWDAIQIDFELPVD